MQIVVSFKRLNGEGYVPSELVSTSEGDLRLYSIFLVARSAVEVTGGREMQATYVQILRHRPISEGDKSDVWEIQKGVREKG